MKTLTSKTKHLFNLFFILLLSGLIASCGNKGGKTEDTPSNQRPGPDNSGDGGGGNGSTPVDRSTLDIPEDLGVEAFVSRGTYSKLKAIDLDRKKKELLVNLPLGMNPYVPVTSGSFKDKPDITYSTVIGEDKRAYLQLRIPLKYIIKGVESRDPRTLPNGDPLPGVTGELAHLAWSLDKDETLSIHMYLGSDQFAVYVETPFDPYFDFSTMLTNATKTETLGMFSMMRAKNGFRGGFYLALVLTPSLAEALDPYIGGKP